ncbi:M28 family peptidase [Nonomuraea sp. NPDC026600]|uniref:M28 family peptidase n=1 Tax=Nonomuraea sp. NPDC026600 TaxID=3155363 RepID=UPI0033F32D1E
MKGKLIDVPRRTLAGLLALLTLAGVIMLTAMGQSTMQPLPASAPGREFSAERALRHLEQFAAEPRPLGSPAGDRARTYLVGQLRAVGLDVEVQRAIGANSASGLASFGQVDNVVATRRGTDATGTLLIAAHYDSAAVGPGASDDGAAVAAMLETVRALGTAPLRNDLVLLMTDGEEDGVLGTEAFVREHPLGRKGGVLLNWEARGVSGPSLMFETSRNNAGLVSTFAAAAPHPRGDSVMGELYRLLPNNTDFTPLAKAGFTGMNFAYIERSSRYHTADDSIANLDRGSLQHHGSTMLALARTLGDADLPALAADHDVTYFRILGVMVTYPSRLVWPLAVLAVLAVAGLALLARRARLASIPRIIVAAASATAPLVLAVILAQGLWEVLVALRPAYDGMGGLLHRPLAYQAAVTLLAALALLAWYLPLRGRLGPAALAIGALVWPAGLGVLAAWFAPGAAFVLTLPALLCALGGLAALLLPGAVWRVVALTLGASMAAMLLPALAGTAFDGMGLALGGVSALVLALFGLTLLPLAELALPEPSRDGGRGSGLGVVVVAVLAVALTGVGFATDAFDATNPQRSHLAYVLNADTRVAHWVSGDAEPTAWTRRYVSGQDTGSLPAGYARRTLWTGDAPVIETEGPRVAILSRAGDTIRLRVRAGQGARSVTLRVERPITQVTAGATGLTPVTVPVSGIRANTWPGEIRFRGIPARGVDITLRVPGTDPVRLTAIAETDGLSAVPGFTPRPPGLVVSTREDGELIAVTRTYDLRPV